MKIRVGFCGVWIACFVLPVWGQIRMIPHVSKQTGGFTPQIIISNTSDRVHSFNLEAYRASGDVLVGTGGTIGAGTTYYRSLDDLFGSEDVSHFLILGDEEVRVSISYEGTTGKASPVHVHETAIQAERWQIYPGDWDVVWDGFALVNTGNASADVTVKQVDEFGATRATNSTLSGIAPMEKRLFVLGDHFSFEADTHFVIEATQPVALTALRGSRADSGFSLLWENAAIGPAQSASSSPMPGVEYSTVNQTGIDLRSQGAQNLASVTVSAPGPGYVVVRFDGQVIPDPGDWVILGVSPISETWFPNEGNVGSDVETSFSHTLVFDIDAAGDFTYYAVGHNATMTGGSGRESIYGILTATYFPVRY